MSQPIPLTQQFFIFANCNMVPDRYDEWQAAYDTLAEYVFANEPNTLTYYFGIPLEHAANPSRTDFMLAFEAYGSRSDLYDVHIKSEVMQNQFFPQSSPAMAAGLDLAHYSAVGGFLDRSGCKKECGIMNDVQITCTSEAARSELLGALRLLCRLVEAGQGSEGKDGQVLSFLGFQSLDNDESARLFARYESRDVWESWQRSSLINKFWEAVKPNVGRLEARAYVPNGKGWLWK